MRGVAALSLLMVLLNLLAVACLPQRAMGGQVDALSSIVICLGSGRSETTLDKADAPASAPMSVMCAHCLPISDGAFAPPADIRFQISARDAMRYVAYAMPVEHFDRSFPPQINASPRAPPPA